MSQELYITAGLETSKIGVKISHRIIQLFSEGLYSSSNKAVEELVSNSFDAGAQNVHVIFSSDLRDPDATIVVIDDGEGMDEEGLRQHWIIGVSHRRKSSRSDGRKPIGKFGIGKLATYVLAKRLTHICKSGGRYFATTMDYTNLSSEENEGIYDEEKLELPLRELDQFEAESVLDFWLNGTKEGYRALKLFGADAKASWTVAIMSGLTDMGKKIQRGRLKWILRTAMPLRDDFNLYLDGDPLKPSKVDLPLVHRWIIGKDITQLAKPCPKNLEVTEDDSFTEDLHRFGLSHPELGRITGYAELYEDALVGAKSDSIERSNGFFVYVRERLINIEDPGFGIDRNLLRHGTFSRLRVVVHMNGLDEELRSSRETLRLGNRYNLAKNFLHAVFNLARNKLLEHEQSKTPGALMAARLSSAPGSITRKPLVALVQLAIEGKANPIYTSFPTSLSSEKKTQFLDELRDRAESPAGLVGKSEIAELSASEGMAVYDVVNGKLQINAFHPFVASFLDEFQNIKTSLPLEMLCMSEVLMEAHLYVMGLGEDQIRDILGRRDELLRQLVRTSGRRNAQMIALALMDARDDEDKLEEEMRAAFEAMGFANVIRIGGRGTPDGTAEAYLPATEDGQKQRYKVGLEAKSGGKVSAKRMGVSGIARHMEHYKCDHHVVIGNGFATSTGEDSASVEEINRERENSGRTITLMHIDDLARLVRLIPPKRIGLSRLRDLFKTCVTPEASKAWVDTISQETPENWPYKEILETIWKLSNENYSEAVEYAAVQTELRHCTLPQKLSKSELIGCCKALQTMARGVVYARDTTVEIDRRPDLIIEDVRAAIRDFPEKEQKTINI